MVLFCGEGVRDLSSSSCKGFSPAHKGRQLRFVVGNSPLLLVPPKESLSLHLTGNLLMVFDGLEEALSRGCCPKQVGVASSFPLTYLQAGLFPVCGNHLLAGCFVREPSRFFSSTLASPPVFVSQLASCLMLPLIQFLFSHLAFLTPSEICILPL